MSRRENCVWHPMPEEVRRSSVQSRRASLAAGRRKSQNAGKDQPDWEVEAPPTPPPADDYSSRQPVAAAAVVVPVEEEPAAAAEPVAEPELEAAAQAEEEKEEEEAVAAVVPVTVVAAVPAEEEQQPAALQARNKEEAIIAATAGGDGHAVKKQKTRHTIRFRGANWPAAMKEKGEEIKAAFLKDIWNAAKVKEEDAVNMKLSWDDCMVITFVMLHAKGQKRRQNAVHKKLMDYDFPFVCAEYPHHHKEHDEL